MAQLVNTATTPETPADLAAMVAVLDAVETVPDATTLREHSYELLRLQPGATVVDVGCGTGRAVAELTERGVAAMGVDPAAPVLALARDRHPGADLHAGTAERLPWPTSRWPDTGPTRFTTS